MTATVQTATESSKIAVSGSRAPAIESGFEAALLGSVGKAIGAPAAHDPTGVGHGSASTAPGKRKDEEKEVVKRARAMSDPAAIASGELATHGAPKATVQAAEAQQISPDAKDTPSRPRPAAVSSQPAPAPKGDSQSQRSSADNSKTGPSRAADSKSLTSPGNRSDPSIRRPASPRDALPVPKAASGPAKPLDAGQALARLAQAINRAADRGANQSGANRSVLRVETARAAQKNVPTKSPAPAASPGRTQETQEDFAAQLHRGFAAVLRQSGGSLTLRMQPEALGDLTIRMNLQPGQIQAEFEVGSVQARQLLSANMTSLRSALEARGLSVDKLTVSVSDPPTPEALANRAELGGGAGNPGTGSGGASGGRADQSGVEHPLTSGMKSRSDEGVVSDPGSGLDVHMGGAQTVRLVLDAVA